MRLGEEESAGREAQRERMPCRDQEDRMHQALFDKT